MSALEPVRMACPRCGARYRVPSESLSGGRPPSCRQCSTTLKESRRGTHTAHPPNQPVSEDLILAWLNEADRDEA